MGAGALSLRTDFINKFSSIEAWPEFDFRAVSDNSTDMKVTSRDFQRDFARMKGKAASGEPVHVVSSGAEFVFQAVKPKTWRGALKGKAKITGDLRSTGLAWEASK